MFKLHGSNAHTTTTGDNGDISNICKYGWYEWCYFCENKKKSPFNKEVLGRVLGPAKGEGNKMDQWILNANGKVVTQLLQRPMKTEEVHYEREQIKRKILDELIVRRWGTSINAPSIEGTEE